MIVLDTNVISETARPAADQRVIRWLDRQSAETMFITAVTLGELHWGVEALPSGRRRDDLTRWWQHTVLPLFDGRILDYGAAAATRFGAVLAVARERGTAISTADAFIAAIALSTGFTVATRDTTPFAAVGLPVINPWSADFSAE